MSPDDIDRIAELWDRKDKEREKYDDLREKRQEEINDQLIKSNQEVSKGLAELLKSEARREQNAKHVNNQLEEHSADIAELKKVDREVLMELTKNTQASRTFTKIAFAVLAAFLTGITAAFVSWTSTLSQPNETAAKVDDLKVIMSEIYKRQRDDQKKKD